ncbi:MAG: hypothetical protein HKN58_00310 [Xanthomonadales bacterium]|nr:hypothetical protein [Xanthomonadales bacterium]
MDAKAADIKNADPVRLLMYSHDSWGLGHLRRSLAIAGAVTGRIAGANVLIVTGSPCATQFELPERVDVLKLPAVSKADCGRYISRHWPGRLQGTLELRRRLINESYRAFDPQIVIVDHQLTGLYHEALPMLREARAAGKTLIYGMRDVLDAPETVAEQWRGDEQQWALHEGYDLICVYGTPEVYDPRIEYHELDRHRDRIVFSGYVAAPAPAFRWRAIPSLRRSVLVTMGGGGDGAERIRSYLAALSLAPPDWDSQIVCGPLLEHEQVDMLRGEISRLGLGDVVQLDRFSDDVPKRMREADAIVSMAGYNSCAEILQSRVPAVLMPRTQPRTEQLIRATQLERLELARCQTDHSPDALRQAVEAALQQHKPVGKVPSLDGLTRVCDLVESRVAAAPRQPSPKQPEAARAV